MKESESNQYETISNDELENYLSQIESRYAEAFSKLSQIEDKKTDTTP